MSACSGLKCSLALTHRRCAKLSNDQNAMLVLASMVALAERVSFLQSRTPAGRSLVADRSHVQNLVAFFDRLSQSPAESGETTSGSAAGDSRTAPQTTSSVAVRPFAMSVGMSSLPRSPTANHSRMWCAVLVWWSQGWAAKRPSWAQAGTGCDAFRALDRRPFRVRKPPRKATSRS
jgi:hypothetical protein